MTPATVFFALLFYAASAVLVAGVAWRVADFARTPAPLKIPTTPAPTSAGGVVLRMAREVLLFESLFKANLWIWLFGWLFHVALALVLARHLRYFTEPVWTWVRWIQPFGVYAGLAMVAVLVAIGATGLLMKFGRHTDIVAVKAFFLGLIRFDWQPLPDHPALWLHLLLVAALMIVFPMSKLLHAPGVFFSPTRNQADNPRETRHLAPWAARLEAGDRSE
jgi:nitrate reductase gamma subunit